MSAQTTGCSTFGGALIIAGTCIGGGMLALPVSTSLAGFIPALTTYIVCCLFMMSTGLLMAEVCLGTPGDSNLISMATRTLGKWGKRASWVLYLFLFYSLTLAYEVQCGHLFKEAVGLDLPLWCYMLAFVGLFGSFIFCGTHAVEKVNEFLMAGLCLTFLMFVYFAFAEVDLDRLSHRNWTEAALALPVSFTAFAFQGVVPTLVRAMHHDRQRIRRAIIIGSGLPFFCYCVWQGVVQGCVPTFGPGGLAEALEKGVDAAVPLKKALQDPRVLIVSDFFAFCALVTSFLGVTLGLRDFLADGLQIKKTAKGKLIICLLIFLPPIVIGTVNPHIFLTALSLAGGVGCALLLGLVPTLMAWVDRKRMDRSDHLLPGGYPLLVALIVFVLFELGSQAAFLHNLISH